MRSVYRVTFINPDDTKFRVVGVADDVKAAMATATDFVRKTNEDAIAIDAVALGECAFFQSKLTDEERRLMLVT